MTEECRLAARIIRVARSWSGTPYHHQASVKGAGCDCLGLVRGVWREVFEQEPEPVPAYSSTWAEAAGRESLLQAAHRHLIAVQDPLPGDVLCFRMRSHAPAKHLGILTECNRFIHAYDGQRVVETFYTSPWRRRLAQAFRFPQISGEHGLNLGRESTWPL